VSDDDKDKGITVAGSSVPMTWTTGGKQVGPTQHLVQRPTEGEVNTFSSQRRKTCATCQFMEVNEKTKELIRRSDVRRNLKHQNKWRAEYLPIIKSFDELGICAQSRAMVGPTSGACSFHKAKR
jgi:hypothetical protein